MSHLKQKHKLLICFDVKINLDFYTSASDESVEDVIILFMPRSQQSFCNIVVSSDNQRGIYLAYRFEYDDNTRFRLRK